MKDNQKDQKQIVRECREEIGHKIRTIREKRGYSQDQLSQIMEVNRTTISKVENGKFALSIDYLLRFSKYLNFDVALVEKEGQSI
jgi:transcriptional regulator with XRE-family HTH domain